MSSISTMHFNWLPQPSLFAQAQAWTERQAVLRQQMDDFATYSDNFATVAINQTQGLSNIAAQTALDRVQSAASAKANSVLSSGSNSSSSSSSASSNSSPALTLPDGTVIADDPTQYLPGGSKLDLDTGTLTLANGTMIDTTTGLKKVDLSV